MKKTRWVLILPVLAGGFVPLLVHSYIYHTGYEVFDWFPDVSAYNTDYFLAYKMFALILIGIAAAIVLFFNCVRQNRKLSHYEPVFLFLIAYVVLVLMSGIFSGNAAFAFRGGYEMFEPVWIVLTYSLLCFYTYYYVRTKGDAFYILKLAGCGVFLVNLIGIFQFFHLDLFRTDFGKKLILSPAAWDTELIFTFRLGQVYTTLYNVDFLSLYYSLLIPLLFTLIIGAPKKSQKAICIILEVMSVICLIGSTASSGIAALIAAGIIGLYVLLSRKRQTFLIGIIIGIVVFIAAIPVSLFSPIGERISTWLCCAPDHMENASLSAIETNDEGVVFTINGNTLKVSYYTDGIGSFSTVCWDGEGNEIPLYTDDGIVFHLSDIRYGECDICAVFIDEYLSMRVTIDGHNWLFTNQTDGTYYYCNSAGKFTKFPKARYFRILPDWAMNGRGEIWNHIFPLLPRSIFLGSGANTFAITYPNDDYLIKEYSGMQNLIDVKAHCWYLMQWVENGLIALLCLLAFLGWYLIRSIKIYRKGDIRQPLFALGFGCFVGILAYLITALANDSNVCTAPVFWVMLGLGMTVNRINEEL